MRFDRVFVHKEVIWKLCVKIVIIVNCHYLLGAFFVLLLYRDTWKEEVNEKLKSLNLKMEKILQILDGKQNIVTTKKHPQENVNSTPPMKKVKIYFACSDTIKSKNMLIHNKETLVRLKFLKSRLSGWRTSVHNKTQAEKWAKYVEECDRAIIPENVQNILSSKPAIQGMKALTAAKAGKELTPCQFSAAKDLILTAFSIQNGSRPGTVNNATVQNYESARRPRVARW